MKCFTYYCWLVSVVQKHLEEKKIAFNMERNSMFIHTKRDFQNPIYATPH